jgi:hypothetical protein
MKRVIEMSEREEKERVAKQKVQEEDTAKQALAAAKAEEQRAALMK